MLNPTGSAKCIAASWPGLTRPSTTLLRDGQDVDARHKAGHYDVKFHQVRARAIELTPARDALGAMLRSDVYVKRSCRSDRYQCIKAPTL
jgi:hypothetical protein